MGVDPFLPHSPHVINQVGRQSSGQAMGWTGSRVDRQSGGQAIGWTGNRVGRQSGGQAIGWAGNRVGRQSGGQGAARLFGMHISETAGWIFYIQSSLELFWPEDYNTMIICPWAKTYVSNLAPVDPDFEECISPKPLDTFTPFKVLWNFLDL